MPQVEYGLWMQFWFLTVHLLALCFQCSSLPPFLPSTHVFLPYHCPFTGLSSPILCTSCCYHCPQAALAWLLHTSLYHPYRVPWVSSLPYAFLSCPPLCDTSLAHPTPAALLMLHPILHFALPASPFPFLPVSSSHPLLVSQLTDPHWKYPGKVPL